MEMEIFYEGYYSKLDKKRKEEMFGYGFDPELYKDWPKIIKRILKSLKR